MTLDAEALAKIAATGLAGIFAGASSYISIVQHPALEVTDDLGVQAPFFHYMYPRAASMQAPSAVLSGASAIAVYYLQKDRPVEMQLWWLYSGCAMLAIVPYTVVTMLPLNHQLMDPKRCLAEGQTWMQNSLKRWMKLHTVRTGVSLAAFATMLVALAKSSGVHQIEHHVAIAINYPHVVLVSPFKRIRDVSDQLRYSSYALPFLLLPPRLLRQRCSLGDLRMARVHAEALAKIAAAGLAGVFAGAATFISVAQHPALLETDELAFQAPFFRRMYFYAARMQGPMAVGSGLSALVVYFLQRERQAAQMTAAAAATTFACGLHSPRLWLASGCLMIAITPFTVVKMLAINYQLVNPKVCRSRGKTWLQRTLAKWGKLHNVRTGVSLLAFTGMIVAMAYSGGHEQQQQQYYYQQQLQANPVRASIQ